MNIKRTTIKNGKATKVIIQNNSTNEYFSKLRMKAVNKNSAVIEYNEHSNTHFSLNYSNSHIQHFYMV